MSAGSTGGVMAAALAAILLAGPSVAGETGPPDRTGTGTGGGPSSTITAPYTTSDGVTKPPGDALGPAEGTDPALRRRSRQIDREIEADICKGCN